MSNFELETMSTGDFYILFVVALGAVLALGYLFWAMLSKGNRGTWDTHSKIVSKFRSRRWSYKQQVASAREFLLRADAAKAQYWPGLDQALGLDTVRSSRNDNWAAAFVQASAVQQDLYFTFEVPQRSDGSELNISEVSFVAEPEAQPVVEPEAQPVAEPGTGIESSASALNTWRVESVDAATLASLGNSPFAKWLESLRGVAAVHLIGSRLTIALPDHSLGEETLETLEKLVKAAKDAAVTIPDMHWEN
ncbi:MAG: hypothetical protein SPG61_01430 [Arcanobacterium sp.]|nr:hypothetical protein [Arcanobacterium sp.]